MCLVAFVLKCQTKKKILTKFKFQCECMNIPLTKHPFGLGLQICLKGLLLKLVQQHCSWGIKLFACLQK